MDEIIRRIKLVEAADTDNFVHLVKLAGLDPSSDFRDFDLSGVNFENCDLRAFDFCGSDISGCIFDGAQISGLRVDSAAVFLPQLSEARDYEEFIRSMHDVNIHAVASIFYLHNKEVELSSGDIPRRLNFAIFADAIGLSEESAFEHVDRFNLQEAGYILDPEAIEKIRKEGILADDVEAKRFFQNFASFFNARFRESTFGLERPNFTVVREILESELSMLQVDAEAGHPGAMLKLAIANAQGHITSTNPNLAIFWLRKVPGDYRNEYGLTAIIVAAEFGFLEVLKFKIDEGADVNAQTIDGFTALIAASVNGRDAIVDYLVNAGADLTASTSNGDTALIAASFRGHLEIVEYLLRKGCDTDEVISQGTTALMAASVEGHLDITRQLCANGASTGLKNFDGCSALELAKESRQFETYGFLLEVIGRPSA